jgi:hypothetical protein
MGGLLGRSLRVKEVSPDEARRELPIPTPALNMLLNAWAAAAGRPALVTSTVAEITGARADVPRLGQGVCRGVSRVIRAE